jgi:hypothetical protein
MPHAPASIIIVPVPYPAAGSPEVLRQAKPRYPAKPKVERWRPAQSIPHKLPEPMRRQAEAQREAGRRMLDAAMRARAA